MAKPAPVIRTKAFPEAFSKLFMSHLLPLTVREAFNFFQSFQRRETERIKHGAWVLVDVECYMPEVPSVFVMLGV